MFIVGGVADGEGVTLPYNSTELLNCFWSGPTSVKSFGTLFILSPNIVIKATVFTGSGSVVAPAPWSG